MLEGGKVYDLTLRLTGIGNHYQIGSPDPLLELGWAGPLYSLEPRPSLWAINVEEGESVQVYLDAAPPEANPEASPQLTVTIQGPDGAQLIPPSRFDPLPAELSIPAVSPGGTLMLHLEGERSYVLNKTKLLRLGLLRHPVSLGLCWTRGFRTQLCAACLRWQRGPGPSPKRGATVCR